MRDFNEAKDALGTVLAVGDYVTTAELRQYRVASIGVSEHHITFIVGEDRHGTAIKMMPWLTVKCGRQAWYE